MRGIRETLLDQKTELEKRLKQIYIIRDAKIREVKSDLIKVIIGPRRSGKSFFAIHELMNSGTFGYANFDEETLVESKNYNEIIMELDSIYNKPKYLLFDEIQNLEKWELFVNRLQRQGYNLVVTGSNSNLLSKELATHLTGRHTKTDILPLSFREILSHSDHELTESEVKVRFSEYVDFGGYPEPLVKKLDYKDYLSDLFGSIIYKDVIKRYSIRKPKVIEELAIYLISNSAKEFSYNNLTNMTKSESTHTIKKYIGYLEEAFIFFEISRYSAKLKEQITSTKKIYCVDNGIIYAKAFKTSGEKGRLYENIVAIELKRRAAEGGSEFYYWKNVQQEEVDFVLRVNRKLTELIQVSADISRKETKDREIRALLKGSRELECDNLTVLTGDYEGKESLEWFGIKRNVNFIPLWKWLLNSGKGKLSELKPLDWGKGTKNASIDIDDELYGGRNRRL